VRRSPVAVVRQSEAGLRGAIGEQHGNFMCHCGTFPRQLRRSRLAYLEPFHFPVTEEPEHHTFNALVATQILRVDGSRFFRDKKP
jgi:hypothetical protein